MLSISPDPDRPGVNILKSEVVVRRGLDEVFPFFADAANLDRLTPPWLKFEIVTPMPVEMRRGVLLDYRLRVRFVPIRWRSEITIWDPPLRFMDCQRRGPYRVWEHLHTFEAVAGGVRLGDVVHYAVPGGSIVDRLFVRPDLRRIFTYRQEQILKLFGPAAGS